MAELLLTHTYTRKQLQMQKSTAPKEQNKQKGKYLLVLLWRILRIEWVKWSYVSWSAFSFACFALNRHTLSNTVLKTNMSLGVVVFLQMHSLLVTLSVCSNVSFARNTLFFVLVTLMFCYVCFLFLKNLIRFYRK